MQKSGCKRKKQDYSGAIEGGRVPVRPGWGELREALGPSFRFASLLCASTKSLIRLLHSTGTTCERLFQRPCPTQSRLHNTFACPTTDNNIQLTTRRPRFRHMRSSMASWLYALMKTLEKVALC